MSSIDQILDGAMRNPEAEREGNPVLGITRMTASLPDGATNFQPVALKSKRERGRHSESHLRSIAKALSWRVIAFTVTASVVWGATGEASFAALVGTADAIIKLVAYYGHERMWNFLHFGLPESRGT